MMKRFGFIVVFSFYVGCLAAGAQQKPNIIWILSEDISVDLACYGTPLVKTPNLDAMAEAGIRFTNAYATAPVCSPSRSAIITGMFQTTIGAHNHRSHRDDGYKLPRGIKPITDYLRQAGYFTVNLTTVAEGVTEPAKTDFNFQPDHPVFDGNDWNKRKTGQPFFAQLTIDETHRSKKWETVVPAHQPRIDPDKIKLPSYYPDHPVIRKDWATYLESIQLMDSYVGKLFKRLEEEGLAGNTIVIFTGDNGRCMIRDKQFLYEGGIHVPFLIRWPGKLKPGTVDERLVSMIDISASILDFAGIKIPSYMEGRPLFNSKPVIRDHIIAARDRMDETVDKMRAVRTKEYKYIRNYYPERPYMQANKYKETQYPAWNIMKELYSTGKLTSQQALFCAPTKPKEELYAIGRDPEELNNLASVQEYQKELVHMRQLLDDWIKKSGDLGQKPEEKIWLPENQKQ
ncbi:sulfatase family protein [Flavitalea antarctica]